jgi:hypothetical protein
VKANTVPSRNVSFQRLMEKGWVGSGRWCGWKEEQGTKSWRPSQVIPLNSASLWDTMCSASRMVLAMGTSLCFKNGGQRTKLEAARPGLRILR